MNPSAAGAVDLKGKVALVTGAGRRVGRVIALELAAQGTNIIIHHSSSDADADSAAAEVQALGVQALVVKADLRRPDAIQAMFEAVRAQFGRLDVLVNSAASFKATPIMDVSLDEWNDVLALNLTAPFLCSQHAARWMLAQAEGGAIINIVDLSAYKPWKHFPHHSVSKAALMHLTGVLAASLGPRIRVNAVAPGPVLRDEGNSPEAWELIGARLPLKRTGDPRDVARAVVFLASQPFITGETLRVDGGEGLL